MDTPLPDASPPTPSGEAAIVLSCEEIRGLLPEYAQGALLPGAEADIDAHLESCDACARELLELRKEDEMLSEALADLKPSESFRARVSVMAELQLQAERMAESLPERGWAVFRWIFAAAAASLFAWTRYSGADPLGDPAGIAAAAREGAMFFWVNLTVFLLALFLLLGSRIVARANRWLTSRLLGQADPGPSKLEILTLEALGLCGVVAASVFNFVQPM